MLATRPHPIFMATQVLRPQTAQTTRIDALDGWRGIAILMVIFEHLQWAKLGHPLSKWSETGQHGVTLFFVLSGFLITSKLMENQNLKQFYVRRFFRLMPAAWLFLAVALLLHKFAGAPMRPRNELLGCLFFFRNYVIDPGTITRHFWSLSLEEQFYLLWPLVLLMSGRRKAKWLAVTGALAIASWRTFHWSWYNRYPFDFRSEVRADALLIGCAAALFLSEPVTREFAVRWSQHLKWIALAIFIACVAWFTFLPPLVENLGIAILIVATVTHPHSADSRILAWKPLVWLGLVSYSVYLWQGLLALRQWSWFGSFYLMLLAVGTYYYVEKPCRQFGVRITRGWR